jgi:hypothetical protein
MFQFWRIVIFSLVFTNLPFLEIRYLTSQKIIRRICSSVLGNPCCFISFLALHKLYTVELKTTQQSIPHIFFVFHCLHPSSIICCQSRRGLVTLHRCMQVLHIRELKLHMKKIWSRLSIPFLQSIHCLSPVYPQAARRSPVVSLFWTANNNKKKLVLE